MEEKRKKNNSYGAAEGYCLRRTRKRLLWILWAVLVLFIAVAVGAAFLTGMSQDRGGWEAMDYVTIFVSGCGAAVLFLFGVYLAFVAVRDTFFPEKSGLADSIRRQLPYPEEAPPVGELFAMVDEDLRENGQWFGEVGIGKEWVLGDLANRIDRIRGIFTVDEVHRHHTQTGIRTSRTLQLVLIDDRWQRNTTSFSSPKTLRKAADVLAARVPEARRGVNGQYRDFWQMDERQRAEFEREFQRRRNCEDDEKLKMTGIND